MEQNEQYLQEVHEHEQYLQELRDIVVATRNDIFIKHLEECRDKIRKDKTSSVELQEYYKRLWHL